MPAASLYSDTTSTVCSSSWLLLSAGPPLRRARAGPRDPTGLPSPLTRGLRLWDQPSLGHQDWKQWPGAELSVCSDHKLSPQALLPGLSNAQVSRGPHFLRAATKQNNAWWASPALCLSSEVPVSHAVPLLRGDSALPEAGLPAWKPAGSHHPSLPHSSEGRYPSRVHQLTRLKTRFEADF